MKVFLLVTVLVVATQGQDYPQNFGDECDYHNLGLCIAPVQEKSKDVMNDLQGHFVRVFYNGGQASHHDAEEIIEEMKKLCELGRENLRCMREYECLDPMQLESYEYMCGEGLEALARNMDCLTDSMLVNDVIMCAKPFMDYSQAQLDVNSICRMTFDLAECIEVALNRRCPAVEHVVRHVMKLSEPSLHQAGCEIPRDDTPVVIEDVIDEGGLDPDCPEGKDKSGEFHGHHSSSRSSGSSSHGSSSHGSHSGSSESHLVIGNYHAHGGSRWGRGKMSTGGWIALCLAALTLLMCAIASVLCYRYRKRMNRERAAAASAAAQGDQGLVNPVYVVAADEKPPLEGPVVYAGIPDDSQKVQAELKAVVVTPPEYTADPPASDQAQ